MEEKTNDVDEYHEVIIQALIKAKTKETKAEKIMIRTGLFVLTLLLLGIIYIVFLLNKNGDGGSYLTFIMSDHIILAWIFSLFVSFYYFNEKTKKFEKAEKDFDELKEDIIDRASDIWNTKELEKKKAISFNQLKKNYDINLYHK